MSMSREQLEHNVLKVVREVITDWECDDDFVLSINTLFVKDLGFESIDIVRLVAALEQHFSKPSLPIEKLFLREDSFVDELSVNDVISFVSNSL